MIFKSYGSKNRGGLFHTESRSRFVNEWKLDHMQPVVDRMIVSTAVYSGRRRSRNPS